MRWLIQRFLNNAVKFTEKGQIVISAHLLEEFEASRGALVEFRVKDSGIGIPHDRQAALFQSFTQVDTSTTRKYGGTGLGLAICKRLAQLMDGEVALQSAPGEGSTFSFTARLGYADTPETSESSHFQMVSLTGKRVLVVDDTVLNLQILDKQLTRRGMLTTLFERALPALDWLQNNSVDVIVTDMHMPDMDGQSFAQAVRKRLPDAHIVLLTSGTMPTGADARVFDARLLKPYRQSQLLDALARVTSSQVGTKNVSKGPAPAKDQLILVADDNPVNLKVALAMLTKLGYEASTAVNGREAVDRVAESLRTGTGETPRQYAAILMDANMPVMDGFEATRQILRTHGAAAPPIIALTASVLEEDRLRCLAAGMEGFLPKPMRIDELSEALAQFARQPVTGHTTTLKAIERITAEDTPESTSSDSGLQKALILMDWSRLEQFKEFDDDERTMTREVIALFASDAPVRMDDIQATLRASDSAALSRAAHALKGAASNVGAQALTEACFTLEQSCLQGQWPADAAQQVAQVAQLHSQTLAALKDWVA